MFFKHIKTYHNICVRGQFEDRVRTGSYQIQVAWIAGLEVCA